MNIDALERYLLDIAQQTPRLKIAGDAQDQERARSAQSMLQDPHTTATGCYQATQVLCGDAFRNWEPESLWLTLEREAGIDIPLVNRDKLLAASTLLVIPVFWWEVNAFENTVLAFNNVASDNRVIQEATPAQINWAVYEAELLFGQDDTVDERPGFDREPLEYTGIVLHRAGFVLAPDFLSFAQPALDDLNGDGAQVDKDGVAEAWKKLRKDDLTEREFADTPLDVQLRRLAAVQAHTQDRLEQYAQDMAQLHA